MNKLTLAVNGKRISYTDTNVDKPCILYIHGNSLSSETFQNQFSDSNLASKFRLIALDMLGYGDSDRASNPEQEYNFNSQSYLVGEFIEELKLTDVILVGHSLGGNIAIEVAKQINNVKAIVLLGSPVAEKPMSQEMYLPNEAIPFFFTPDLTEDNIKMLVYALYRNSIDVPQWNIKIIKQSDPLTRAYILTPIMSGDYDDQFIALKQLDIPVAVFHGQNEQLVNIDYLQKTIVPKQWKNKIHVIENGGHMFFFENATYFNSQLERFVKSVL